MWRAWRVVAGGGVATASARRRQRRCCAIRAGNVGGGTNLRISGINASLRHGLPSIKKRRMLSGAVLVTNGNITGAGALIA